jgi:hypothetical protein
MIRVIADDGNFLPGYMAGKWWDTQLIQTAATRQCFVKRIGGSESCLEFTDAGLLPLTAFLGSTPDGFTIHNWPCFLSLDASKYSDPVPEESRIGSSQTTRASRRLKPGRSGDQQAMSI